MKPYNTTRIKSRKFLTNISYKRAKEEDLWNRNFVFHVYVLTIKNINPFSLKWKIFEAKNREMINCPVIYGFVEKRGIDVRNNFHLKFKEWKDKKKYSRKSIDGLFSKSEGSPPTPVATQKMVLTDKVFERKKNWQIKKNKKRWKKKAKEQEKRTEAKNCSKK